jgi:hypothetical protein
MCCIVGICGSIWVQTNQNIVHHDQLQVTSRVTIQCTRKPVFKKSLYPTTEIILDASCYLITPGPRTCPKTRCRSHEPPVRFRSLSNINADRAPHVYNVQITRSTRCKSNEVVLPHMYMITNPRSRAHTLVLAAACVFQMSILNFVPWTPDPRPQASCKPILMEKHVPVITYNSTSLVHVVHVHSCGNLEKPSSIDRSGNLIIHSDPNVQKLCTSCPVQSFSPESKH